MPDSLPPAVFDAWLHARGGASEVTPIGGGLSGAVIYRASGNLRHASGIGVQQWAVRGWPPTVPGERVSEVHRAMRLARQNGCRWTPTVELPGIDSRTVAPPGAVGESRSWVTAAGRVWDCCEWMPGQAPQAADNPADVLRQIAVAIAQFHLAVSTLSPLSVPMAAQQPVAAVTVRLQRIAELGPLLEPLFAGGGDSHRLLAFSSATQRAIECLRHAWSTQRSRAVRLLAAWDRMVLRQQYVFRDIHLGNTLFNKGRLSGIVDYDAVRIDSPATDLARLIGSVRLILQPEEWDREKESLWGEMLTAYRSISEFSAEEERLAWVLAEVSPLITLANWVVWVAVEGRSFPEPSAKIDERIEGWTHIMRHQLAAGLRNSSGFETR